MPAAIPGRSLLTSMEPPPLLSAAPSAAARAFLFLPERSSARTSLPDTSGGPALSSAGMHRFFFQTFQPASLSLSSQLTRLTASGPDVALSRSRARLSSAASCLTWPLLICWVSLAASPPGVALMGPVGSEAWFPARYLSTTRSWVRTCERRVPSRSCRWSRLEFVRYLWCRTAAAAGAPPSAGRAVAEEEDCEETGVLSSAERTSPAPSMKALYLSSAAFWPSVREGRTVEGGSAKTAWMPQKVS
mmetsp:Transcript_15911/g.36690  ORF Transcript_15911/g.36690 Transcript_15911/m.36690 type:complete len:246 (-) Transcript_15911:24-761(-)